VEITSELQRQRVLVRWKRQAEQEQRKTITNKTQRQIILARLIAFVQGDGCIWLHRAFPEIGFYPDHISVARLFVDTFEQLYGRRIKICPLVNHFRVRVRHKVASAELVSLAKFRSLDWYLPRSILVNAATKREWLRAFFDCEAYVGSKVIVVNSVNEIGLREVKELLREFGIESKWYVYHRKQKNWNTNYILHIGKIADRQSFLKHVGFNHPAKQEKLKHSLAAIA